jgi:hypothetical protein
MAAPMCFAQQQVNLDQEVISTSTVVKKRANALSFATSSLRDENGPHESACPRRHHLMFAFLRVRSATAMIPLDLQRDAKQGELLQMKLSSALLPVLYHPVSFFPVELTRERPARKFSSCTVRLSISYCNLLRTDEQLVLDNSFDHPGFLNGNLNDELLRPLTPLGRLGIRDSVIQSGLGVLAAANHRRQSFELSLLVQVSRTFQSVPGSFVERLICLLPGALIPSRNLTPLPPVPEPETCKRSILRQWH